MSARSLARGGSPAAVPTNVNQIRQVAENGARAPDHPCHKMIPLALIRTWSVSQPHSQRIAVSQDFLRTACTCRLGLDVTLTLLQL